MIDEIIWTKALREEYEKVAYIASGQLGLVLTGESEALSQLLPSGADNIDYETYYRQQIETLRLEGDKTQLIEKLGIKQIESELADKDVYTVEFSYHMDEGDVFKRITFYAVDRAAGFYMMLISDTTKIRREQEEQNRILGEALKRAEASSAAKTVFLSNMSHDIRTPMNAIIGFTNLAKQNTEDATKTEEYLDKILRSSNHLLSLINDVLEMSRIESGKIELENGPCNLPQMMDDLYAMVANLAAAKKQELTIRLMNVKDENIICDKLRLNQVMLNLISNAVKYTDEGGRIEVRVLQKDKKNDKQQDKRAVYEFHVKDNGIGMSPEFAAHVFEAFEREKTSTVSGIQGTGLGMAITKSIVDLMDGTIEVITAPGEGTEFIVVIGFEISLDDRNSSDSTKEEDVITDFSGKRLLLVEDVDINREIAKAMLEMDGFLVEEAKNGEQAFAMVSDSAPGYYDTVLMDIQMPVMNGYEAARAIRQLKNRELASVPILAMTANAFAEDIQAAVDAGMQGHVAKPINRDLLIQALAKLL